MIMSSSEYSLRSRILPLAVLLVIGIGTLAYACQVPVFRYALERWTPDWYEVVLTPGKDGWTEKEKSALDLLKSFYNSEEIPINFKLQEAEGSIDPSGGTMRLFYPGRNSETGASPIWEGSLTEGNVRSLVDSPVRRELAKRILEGESAVWVIIESGNEEADTAAKKVIVESAQSAASKLEIPSGVIGRSEIEAGTPAPIDQENVLQSDVPLKIEFSVLSVRRDDPAELLFLQMLLNLETDLHEWTSEPMVFPIFGRGRVLEPLIGKGITEGNALEYSGYLCGACSCEVKDQNPGMDLLMAVNWDAAIEGSEVIIEKVLPPLEGTAILSSLAPVNSEGPASPAELEAVPSEAIEESSAEVETSSGASLAILPLVISLGVIVVLVGLGSVVLLKRNKK